MKHIVVLMGGRSAERSISLASGEACALALEQEGYRVTRLDAQQDVVENLKMLKPDAVFNALHGIFGEDGTVQGLLEYLQIPYTHSGVLASALAMDKDRAKKTVSAAGVPIAPSVCLNRFSITDIDFFPRPYVIKPVYEGSSFGVFLIGEDTEHLPEVLHASDWPYGDMVLVEAFVPGRELTCAVLGDEALDVCEIIVPEEHIFYNNEAKYEKGQSVHICPAELSPNIYQNVQKMALLAHQALGCRGVSRSDFRFDAQKGTLAWLEINTQPGMTATSLVPDIAQKAGYSFNSLVKWIVEDASCMR